MALPCPGCGKPLGLTIEFIMKNPISQCPYCEVIMNFKADEKVVGEYKDALNQIKLILIQKMSHSIELFLPIIPSE